MPGEYLVDLRHIAKTYDGAEASLRGTKLEWKGPALWLRNLRRALNLTTNVAPPVPALVDISLQVTAGEIFGLLGRNGSGKTTLIKILAGLLRPSDGEGEVAGCPLTKPQEIRRRVSYVSTAGWMGLEWPLTARENVAYFASLCGMPSDLARIRAELALRDVGLWEARDKYPSQLSNGMRQRTILARALLFRTPLVLLDEPTVGLDPVTTREMLALFRGLLRERGQTVILTDHQSTEMEAVADRLVVLRNGRVWVRGTPAEVVARLDGLTVIEVTTEEMQRPQGPPPPVVVAVESTDRPGPLGERAWRVHARRRDGALEEVVRWVEQPGGRIILLAESAPALRDVLTLPDVIEAGDPEPASELVSR